MELETVVVADQAGHLLKVTGTGLQASDGGVAVCLLAARDEGLLEEAANRLPAVQPEKAGTRGQAEELVGPRRSEPLKIDRQLRPIEILTRAGGRGKWVGGQI